MSAVFAAAGCLSCGTSAESSNARPTESTPNASNLPAVSAAATETVDTSSAAIERWIDAYMDGTAIGDRMATLGVYQSDLFPRDRSIDPESPWLTSLVDASARGSTYMRTWFDNSPWLRRPIPMKAGATTRDQVVPVNDYSGIVVLAGKEPD